MKYISKYKQFESLQQAEKIINDNNIDEKKSKSLIDEFKKLGLTNYLGYCFQLIHNDDDRIDEIEIFTDTFKNIKQHKINLNEIPIGIKGVDNINDLDNLVSNKIKEKKLHSFINKWCPAELRNDVKLNLKDYHNKKTHRYFYNFDNLSNDKEKMLKKGSRCKTAEEWLQYLKTTLEDGKFSIDELKMSNIKIYHEDDKYLIYKPMDYKSYMIPRFQFWCTLQELQFNNYSRLNMLIILDKNDKTKSYFTYYSLGKINVYDYKNNKISIEEIPEQLKTIILEYYLKH